MKNMMLIHNNHHHNKEEEEEEEDEGHGGCGYEDQSDEKGEMHDVMMGYLPIHSQVMKIRKEFEKVKHPSLALQHPGDEMRRVLHGGLNRQQQRRSRSPLGLPGHHHNHRSISVGADRSSCCCRV